MGCASRDLADTMCGVPATVRNLGSHLLAAWRPYDPFDGPDGRGQNCQTKNPARATLHLLKSRVHRGTTGGLRARLGLQQLRRWSCGGTPRKLIANIDSAISFAPDGNKFTFLRWLPDQKDNFSEIHISDKDGSNDQLLISTAEEAQAPVWSPDGTRIAWFQTEAGTTRIALKVMEISSKKLTTVSAPAGIFWVNPGDAYTTLAWLPDSRHLLAFYYKQHTDRAQIGVVTVPSGEFHSVTNDVNSYSQLALSGNGRTLATVLRQKAMKSPGATSPVSKLCTLPVARSIVPLLKPPTIYSRRSSVAQAMAFGVTRSGSVETGSPPSGLYKAMLESTFDGHILFTGFPKGLTAGLS